MNAEAAIFRRAFTQVRVGALSWGLVFGATIASSALTYVTSFPDAASRRLLAATTSRDTGLAVLLGPISTIDTVGGYTVYKCYAFLTTIGAVWAVLATTRLLRGEEDAGRWQLVLAGGSRASAATTSTLAALGAAGAVIFAGTVACTLLAARNPDVGFGTGESLLYGLSLVVPLAVFVGVAALTSQLSRSRRLASGVAMGVLSVTWVVRMIADSGPATKWLLWLTPFGWTERMRPLTQNDAWPLVPAAVTAIALCGTAVVLAARRDAGDGVLASRDVVPVRPFGLRTPLGLAARLELPVLVAWCVGVTATAFSFGMIAKIATGDVPDSITDTLDKFGVRGNFANQYVGVVFLLVATVVALLPAGQIGAAAEEETSGRLVHLLVQPPRRAGLMATRLLIGGAGIVVAGALAGLFVWVGAKSQGSTSTSRRCSALASTWSDGAARLGHRRAHAVGGPARRWAFGVRRRCVVAARGSLGVDDREPQLARSPLVVPLHGARSGAGHRSDGHLGHPPSRHRALRACDADLRSSRPADRADRRDRNGTTALRFVTFGPVVEGHRGQGSRHGVS